uniref:DUF8039 domain-containing protein n=1 Tax=Lactuca sativa TaxID=4236 RepID=A0A9R1ULB7_LACSA|nr:hypothetical protein LSAT_V11C800443420 [Lactuca sativa]
MNDQPQQQPVPQPQPKPWKKRTTTRLMDITEPLEVEFNGIGQHCGDNQNKFANDRGVVTRKLISIKYPTWKKVPANEKENLWLTIKFYNCGCCFCRKDISEKARMSSMCNTNPTRVGPHGYRGNKPKWEQEKASGQLPSQLYEIKSERSLDYVLGRRSKNESGSKIIPPNMEPIVKKLIDVQKEISNGDLLSGPGEDLLTMAIGPEHPGRTKAVGHDIGLRKGMQGLDKKRGKPWTKKLLVQLDEAVTELAELRTLFPMQQSRNEVPNNLCFCVQNNRSGSTSTLDALDTIKTIIHCDLVLPYGDMNQKCARGMVFPYNDGLIHSLPLRENHLKVMIDNIDERYKGIPIPVMTNEVGILEDAFGTVIQWPRIAIVLSKEQQSKAPSQQQIQTTGARPSTEKVVMEKNMPNQKINKPSPIESLRDLLKTNLMVHVVADVGHLEVGAFDFSVTYEEYYRLLKKQTTDLSIITTWQILLHLMLQKPCQETPINVVNYLVDAMQLHHGKSFLIAPYLQKYLKLLSILIVICFLFLFFLILKFQTITSMHWVLLVICPSNHIVYILDSLMKPMKNPVDNYYLLKLLEK